MPDELIYSRRRIEQFTLSNTLRSKEAMDHAFRWFTTRNHTQQSPSADFPHSVDDVRDTSTHPDLHQAISNVRDVNHFANIRRQRSERAEWDWIGVGFRLRAGAEQSQLSHIDDCGTGPLVCPTLTTALARRSLLAKSLALRPWPSTVVAAYQGCRSISITLSQKRNATDISQDHTP
jgi:hypothetical protein